MHFRLLSLFLVFSVSSFAQPKPVVSKGDRFIRFNPTFLLEFNDVVISFGAEHRLHERFSVAADAGYIPYSHEFKHAKSTRGFLFRPAFRFFPNSSALFLEGELHYKRVDYLIKDWLGREVVNGVPSYQQYMEFLYRKNVIGAHIKVGRVMPLVRNSNFWWEVYGGLGFRSYSYAVKHKPRSEYQNWNWFGQSVENGSYTLPALPLGFRIMYKLK